MRLTERIAVFVTQTYLLMLLGVVLVVVTPMAFRIFWPFSLIPVVTLAGGGVLYVFEWRARKRK